MAYSDKPQKLKLLLEQKEGLTVQSLEAGLQIVNSLVLDDEEWKDWYWSDIAKALSQLGEYEKAIQVASLIEHKVESAYTFLATALDLVSTKNRDKALLALHHSELAAFQIDGDGYEKWQRAEAMGKLGKSYEGLGEKALAHTIWREAIASAQSGQKTDNPQEIAECSSVLSEITTYLLEAGLIDLATETAQSIRIDGRKEVALSRVAKFSEGKSPS